MTRATWLLTFALFVPAPLFAADARQLFDTGAKALSLGKANEALDAFEAAYKAKPSPSLLFWLGEAHLALGHKVRAARLYRQYLQKLPRGIKASDARMRLAVLKQEMPERRRKNRNLALEEFDLSKKEAAPPARKHSRRRETKRASASSQSAPPAAAPALLPPLPGVEQAQTKSAAVPPPPLPLPGAQPMPVQNAAATPPAAAPGAPPPGMAQSSGAAGVAPPAPAAGTTVAQVQLPAARPAAPPASPRPQPTVTGTMVSSAIAREPKSYLYVNYTARWLVPNGSAMLTYATTASPGSGGTLYTHGVAVGMQTEYFKNGVYLGFGTQDGGVFNSRKDTLLRYEVSWEGIWVPLGSDRILSPHVGVRVGGMGVTSERLTGGSFKPGVALAALAGIDVQPVRWFAITGGMGYDANLGPDLGPNASVSGYSFDFGATVRF